MKRRHGGGQGFPPNLWEICRIGGLPWRAWYRSRKGRAPLEGVGTRPAVIWRKSGFRNPAAATERLVPKRPRIAGSDGSD